MGFIIGMKLRLNLAVNQQVHFDLKHEKLGNLMLTCTSHDNYINIYIYMFFFGGSSHLKHAYNKQ